MSQDNATSAEGQIDGAMTANTAASSMQSSDTSLLHELAKLKAMLDEEKKNRQEVENERQNEKARYEQQLKALAEQTSKEMRERYENALKSWFETVRDSINDKGVQNNFSTAIEDMMTKGQKTPVWEIFCACSEMHNANVNKINNLIQERDDLLKIAKKEMGFSASDARFAAPQEVGNKRTRMESLEAVPNTNAPVVDTTPRVHETDCWTQFELSLRRQNGY